jgi:hypothetical protein
LVPIARIWRAQTFCTTRDIQLHYSKKLPAFCVCHQSDTVLTINRVQKGVSE